MFSITASFHSIPLQANRAFLDALFLNAGNFAGEANLASTDGARVSLKTKTRRRFQPAIHLSALQKGQRDKQREREGDRRTQEQDAF